MQPTFYDPSTIAGAHPSAPALFLPRHQQVAAEALQFRANHEISAATSDQRRIAYFGIDCQLGFCHPDGSLFVPGSPADMARGIGFLYTHLPQITTVVLSLDTHRAHQIFHPVFWCDSEGQMPAPLTPILADDVRNERWRPQCDPALALEYCEKLEATGKYALTIWPFHTLLGSVDHALVPQLFEAAHFHAIARRTQTQLVTKGLAATTENYSVLEPEVKELAGETVGRFDRELYDELLSHDRVIIWGEASSHCVMATIDSLLDEMERDGRRSELAPRLVVLSDCMSPVPAIVGEDGQALPGLDFPAQALAAQERWRGLGVNVTTSAEAVSLF